MSTQPQLATSASTKPPLPIGLLIATILVILQMVARAGFLVTALVMNSRFLGNAPFLVFAVIIPALLLTLTIVMVALIFARTPAAKPFGIVVCILNLLTQINVVGRLISLYSSHPNIAVSAVTVTISVAYIAVFTLVLVFLIRWPIGDATRH